MIKTITFKNAFRVFKKNETYSFKPGVNLIVGDQGAGKSSLLGELRQLSEGKPSEVLKLEVAGPCKVLCFDFEKDTPRRASYIENMGQIACRFISHGQTNMKLLQDMPKAAAGSVILLDEPDSALSIRSCLDLVAKLKKLEKEGVQVICAVHNPIIIEAFEEVLSLEHKKFMTSKDFIDAHSAPVKPAKKKVSTKKKKVTSKKKKA